MTLVHRPFTLAKQDRLAAFALTLAVVGVICALVFFSLWATERSPTPWNPITSPRAAQSVTNGPVIHLGGTVDVTATKCASEAINVRGSTSWESIDAPSAVVFVSYGLGTYPQGCITRSFKHVIPPQVTALVDQGLSTWEIVGTDTPYRPDGTQGVPQSWSTQPFTLKP